MDISVIHLNSKPLSTVNLLYANSQRLLFFFISESRNKAQGSSEGLNSSVNKACLCVTAPR